MKVTAIIPEEIVSEAKKYSGGRNITESLIIALKDYISRQKLRNSISKVEESPLEFRKGYSAGRIRKVNRNR